MSGNQGWEGWQGWLQNQGWMQHQGWQGAGPSGEGGSMLVDGLIRNRESLLALTPGGAGSVGPKLVMPSKGGGKAGPVSDGLPAIAATTELALCAPDVRAKVLVAELLESLRIQPLPRGAKGAKVSVVSGGKPQTLATLLRPSAAIFGEQAVLTEGYAVRRAERAPEILSQVGPQMAYWAAMANLSPERTPNTLELCNTAMVFASFVTQRLKHMLSCPRPQAYSPTLQPMIPTPGFSALPSGHATEAFMMARLLQRLCGFRAKSGANLLLQRQAERIATNRVVAGLHFPVDSIAGRMLGQCLAEYFEHRCMGKPWLARCFDGTQIQPGQAVDFNHTEAMSAPPPAGVSLSAYFNSNLSTPTHTVPGASTNLRWLWSRCSSGRA